MEIVEINFAGSTLSLETGRLAKQANGSVLVRYGETTVLVAATASKKTSEDEDFFPLAVFYVEKAYAAGRIPGGFFKREGRLSDQETLNSRLIDRPLRPMFHPHFRSETIIQATVLSYDQVHAPEVAAMIGASAALRVSDIPFLNPIAGIRIGYVEGQLVANPTPEQLERSALNVFLACSKDALLMVEGEAEQVSEELMVEALLFGQNALQPVLEMQEELQRRAGKPKREVPPPVLNPELFGRVEAVALERVRTALATKEKQARHDAMEEALNLAIQEVGGPTPEASVLKQIPKIIGELEKREMRLKILNEGIRIDGRSSTEIRPISCETNVLPRVHGSALFTRGETQALVVATLGTKDDEQMIDSLSGLYYKNFMLHYNFPSFSVGEAKPPRAPGRREIGHGFLAERGVLATVPSKEEFPYTIRLVSEVLESNGSSSMATVCGSSLAMMDAGVPLKAATAGIAMGLIYEEGRVAVLSDILGDEDHLGDMDFKVVGTAAGITGLQMDIKVAGIDRSIMEKALSQAREGRLHILDIMNQSLHTPREGLSSYAPRFVTHRISKDKIRDVIGPGGKVIKGIVEKTGVKINIDDDGIVYLASTDHQAVDVALDMIRELTRMVEIGAVYTGPVKKIAEFGAFVEVFPGQEGLVHISNLKEGRVKQVTDVVKEGQLVTVKAIGYDKRGKLQLSMKDV